MANQYLRDMAPDGQVLVECVPLIEHESVKLVPLIPDGRGDCDADFTNYNPLL